MSALCAKCESAVHRERALMLMPTDPVLGHRALSALCQSQLRLFLCEETIETGAEGSAGYNVEPHSKETA
jgi:hypothetical protein